MESPSYKELLGFVWQHMKLQRWRFFLILLFDCFAFSIAVIVWPYILSIVVDIFTRFDANRSGAWEALLMPILGGLCLWVYVEVVSRTMGFLMAKALPKLQADLRMTMFDHTQHHSPRYFNERFAGSLANKISDMTTQVESILQQLFFPIVPTIATCLLGAAFLWFVNPLFSAFLLSWTIIHLLICLRFTRSAAHYEQIHGEARSHILGRIVDSLTNNFAVNLFYRFRYESQTLAPFQKTERQSNALARSYVEKMRVFLSLFYFLVVTLGMFGLMVYLWLHDRISTGQVIQVFTTMWSLAMVLWSVSSSLPVLFQSLGMAKQAYSVMQDPSDLGDEKEAKPLAVPKGEIAFQHVTFHYGEKQLFVDKSTLIHSGEKVGLVGYTGAGKSTFVNLILRLYPLLSGKILIDGQDISSVTLKSLREQIALIPQDPILFHRTLWENIAYGNPEALEEEILNAAKLAHCEGFIRAIPGGFQAKVGERGTKLSGGEKQRIAIARAILSSAPILILDEATSSLDSLTEHTIQESLASLMENRTCIVIAHRLSTLAQMDRLLVFDQGQIVEEGTHEMLLQKEGLYARMWRMQVGGFLPDTPYSSP